MRRRRVSDAEAELWRQAVRDVNPFGRELARNEPPARQRPARPLAISEAKRQLPNEGAFRRPYFVYGGGDPGADRRASSRRSPIERTLDLHGLTQVEAHRALLSFVALAHRDGVRLVLVITGKGKASDFRPGILRTRFLDWIEEAPLRAKIARAAPAKPKDGGTGAFYVFIKSKNAGPRKRL